MDNEQIKTNKGFWWECFKSAFRGGLRYASSIALFLFIILGVVRLLNPACWQKLLDFWGGIANDFAWLLPLVAFVIIVGVVIWKRPYNLYKEKADKVKEYETQTVKFICGESDLYLQKRGINWIIRVGIKNQGMKTINNVEVTLKSIDDGINAFADAPLRPAYCLPSEPSTFMVKPEEPRFVEVCSWGEGDKEMRIHYYTNYQLLLTRPREVVEPFLLYTGIKAGHRFIKLCATGDNMRPVYKTFIISTEGEKPSFKELNPSKNENGMKVQP